MITHLPPMFFVCAAGMYDLVQRVFPFGKNMRDAKKCRLAHFLAWKANEETGLIYPAKDTMAKHLCVNSKTIQRMLYELIDDGFLNLIKPGGGKYTSIYKISENWVTTHKDCQNEI
jgi:hypothetical protein